VGSVTLAAIHLNKENQMSVFTLSFKTLQKASWRTMWLRMPLALVLPMAALADAGTLDPTLSGSEK